MGCRPLIIEQRTVVAKTFVKMLKRELQILDTADINDFADIFIEFGFGSQLNRCMGHHAMGRHTN